ncbi:MAG: hypothetical protein R3F17_10450 [Planctomycetota bacterium]
MACCLAAVPRPVQRAERDVVALLAAGLPLLGPTFAWALPERLRRARTDAHAAQEERRAAAEDEEIEGLSGHWLQDLGERVHVESYREVLRFGDLNRRSSLVRKLSGLGAPEHMHLLRECLEDPDEELRIQAFQQLRSWRSHWESRIRAAEHAPDAHSPAGRLAIAEAQADLAQSGVLDPALVAAQWQRTLQAAEAVPEAAGLPLRLRALTELGRTRESRRLYARVSKSVRLTPELVETWARLQFGKRRWRSLRLADRQLRLMGAPRPAWLQAALGDPAKEAGHGS